MAIGFRFLFLVAVTKVASAAEFNFDPQLDSIMM